MSQLLLQDRGGLRTLAPRGGTDVRTIRLEELADPDGPKPKACLGKVGDFGEVMVKCEPQQKPEGQKAGCLDDLGEMMVGSKLSTPLKSFEVSFGRSSKRAVTFSPGASTSKALIRGAYVGWWSLSCFWWSNGWSQGACSDLPCARPGPGLLVRGLGRISG